LAVRSFGSRRDSRIAVMATSPITSKAQSHPYPKAPATGPADEVAEVLQEVPQDVVRTNGSVLDTLESRALAQAYVDQLGLVPDAPLDVEQEGWLVNEINIGAACLHVAEKVANTFLGPPDGAS